MDCNFRDTVIIERLNQTKDIFGAIESNYVAHLILKGAVKYLSGSKTVDNSEVFTTQTIQVTTYHRDVIESDRLVINGKYYKILFINPIGLKEGLQINAEKINM